MSPAATSPATSTFNASAWRARQPRAVWRGATTGAMNNLDTWNTTIRTRLVGVCRRRPDLCDAAFTGGWVAGSGMYVWGLVCTHNTGWQAHRGPN